jgi:hypothetical protein
MNYTSFDIRNIPRLEERGRNIIFMQWLSEEENQTAIACHLKSQDRSLNSQLVVVYL